MPLWLAILLNKLKVAVYMDGDKKKIRFSLNR